MKDRVDPAVRVEPFSKNSPPRLSYLKHGRSGHWDEICEWRQAENVPHQTGRNTKR